MKKLSILFLFVTIALKGFSQAAGPDTTLQSPSFTQGNVLIYYSGGGIYLTGTGQFNEFFQKYSLANYATLLGIQIGTPAWVDKVYVLYGKRTIGANPGYIKSNTYDVVYNSFANLNSKYVSTPAYGPDTIGPIGTSDSISMVDVPANGATFLEATLNYSKPVPIVNDSFFVSLALSQALGDTLVIADTKYNGTPPSPFPMSSWGFAPSGLFYDFNYIFKASGLTGDIDLGIFPHITHTNPLNSVKNVNDDELFVIPFPNPAADQFNMLYDISKSEKVRITLTDMLGRIVVDLGYKTQTSGAHTEQIDVSKLATGIYSYNVETTSGNKTGKLMVRH